MTAKREDSGAEWFSGGARLIGMQRHADARGSLLPLDFDSLPFVPRRLFTVSGMPPGTVRGGHAHRDGEQLLICLQGQVDLWLRRRNEEAELSLLQDGPALLIGPKVWCRQTYARAETVLLVVSSRPYDPDSYIDSWDIA